MLAIARGLPTLTVLPNAIVARVGCLLISSAPAVAALTELGASEPHKSDLPRAGLEAHLSVVLCHTDRCDFRKPGGFYKPDARSVRLDFNIPPGLCLPAQAICVLLGHGNTVAIKERLAYLLWPISDP